MRKRIINTKMVFSTSTSGNGSIAKSNKRFNNRVVKSKLR